MLFYENSGLKKYEGKLSKELICKYTEILKAELNLQPVDFTIINEIHGITVSVDEIQLSEGLILKQILIGVCFMKDYLKPTKMSDCTNEKIKQRALEITQGAANATQKAIKIFYYIRDAIPFNATLDIFKKASKVLEKGTYDFCCKINLHLTLLKAIGIPSRLKVVEISKDYLKELIPNFLFNRIPGTIGHFYCECYLKNRWIACEALYDKRLYQGMIAGGIRNSQEIPTIDWDGENDLYLHEPFIKGEKCTYSSYDELIEEEIKTVPFPPKIVCKTFDWLACYGSQRLTNKIRKLALSS